MSLALPCLALGLVQRLPCGAWLLCRSIAFACLAGYQLVGAAVSQCLADSSFSEAMPTCQVCGVDSFKAGEEPGSRCQACTEFSSTLGRTAQSECLCDAGYGFDGASGRCVACALNMFKAGPGNGPCVSCNAGYMTLGEAASGCVGVPCAVAQTTRFGSVATTLENRFPSVAQYSCEVGYALPTSDNGQRQCQTDGTWSGEPPACSPICGDALHVEGEECDDGVLGSVDGCDNECRVVPGYYCRTPGQPCQRCSFEDTAQDETSDCTELATKRDEWLRSNLGTTVDIHENCANPVYSQRLLSQRGRSANCAVFQYEVNVTFPKGGTDMSVATFTSMDTVAPVLDAVPAGGVVACSRVPAGLAQIRASDTCGEPVNITFADVALPGGCDTNYTLVRTWTATDTCLNTDTAQATYTVIDTEPPVVVSPPRELVVECSRAAEQMEAIAPWLGSLGGAEVQDACRSQVTFTHDFEAVRAGLLTECAGTGAVTVTFAVTDDCGNRVTTTGRIVRRDSIAPRLVGFPANETIECPREAGPAANVSAADDCDPNATLQFVETREDDPCGHGYTLRRTWRAEDACGNVNERTQVVLVHDTTGPAFPNGPTPLRLQCDPAGNAAALQAYLAANGNATASDLCGGAVRWSWAMSELMPVCGLAGNYTATFYATDVCNNVAAVEAPVWVADTLPPELLGLASDATVECDRVPTPEDVRVADACDASPAVAFADRRVDGRCPHAYTLLRHVTATDACGNVDNATQALTVVDTTAPHIFSLPARVQVECDGLGNAPALAQWLETFGNASVADACGGEVVGSHDFARNRSVTEGCAATYAASAVFRFEDVCGNGVEQRATLEAVDTVGPVLAGVPAGVDLECESPELPEPERPAVATVTGFDVCGQEARNVSYTERRLPGRCAHEAVYERRWESRDGCGNTASQVQAVRIVDTKPPQVLKAPAALVLECDRVSNAALLSAWLQSAGGAVAVDGCGSEVTWTHNVVDMQALLKLSCAAASARVATTVIFTVADVCGNRANATASFELVDTAAPVLATPPKPAVLECNPSLNGAQVEAWAQQSGGGRALDACDTRLSTTYAQNGAAVPGCAATFEAEYTFQFMDDCNNSLPVVGQVQVVDRLPATVTLAGPSPQITEAGFAWLDPGVASALDVCEGDITGRAARASEVDVGRLGATVVNYTVVDACGVTGMASRTVVVVDTLPPRVRLEGAPAPVVRVRQGSRYVLPATVVAVDGHDGLLNSSTAVRVLPELATLTLTRGIKTVVVVAEDRSGNRAVKDVQTVIVLPPVSAAVPNATVVSATMALTFVTDLTVPDERTRTVGFSLWLALSEDSWSAARVQDLLLSVDAGVYALPRCRAARGRTYCRLDLVDAAVDVLEALSRREGVAALAARASPVASFQLGLLESNGTTRAMQEDTLRRLGADTLALVGCDAGFCRWEVDRREVTRAVPVARPHPRSRFVLVVEEAWKDAARVEAELLGLGFLPLAVQAVELETGAGASAGNRYAVDVSGYLSAEALREPLRQAAMELDGAVAVYFAHAFNVTLSPGVGLGQLHAALYESGIAAAQVTVHGQAPEAVVATVTSFGDVHFTQLEQLASLPAVARVGQLQIAATRRLTENAFPYTYRMELDFSNFTAQDPAQGTDTTAGPTVRPLPTAGPMEMPQPREYLEAVLRQQGDGRAFQVLCSDLSEDALRAVCEVSTSWELEAAELAALVRQTPGLIAAAQLSDESRGDDLADAVNAWIGEKKRV